MSVHADKHMGLQEYKSCNKDIRDASKISVTRLVVAVKRKDQTWLCLEAMMFDLNSQESG